MISHSTRSTASKAGVSLCKSSRTGASRWNWRGPTRSATVSVISTASCSSRGSVARSEWIYGTSARRMDAAFASLSTFYYPMQPARKSGTIRRSAAFTEMPYCLSWNAPRRCITTQNILLLCISWVRREVISRRCSSNKIRVLASKIVARVSVRPLHRLS